MSSKKLENWITSNTYHVNDFRDLEKLKQLKEKRGVSVAVVIPTLNEEETIGSILSCLINTLIIENEIIDELVVIDGNSSDRTEEVCRAYSDRVRFCVASEILTDIANYKGKGIQLWKGLYVTKSDIVLYTDSDIKNFDERFIVGLLGPLLENEKVKFVKGFYKRPFIASSSVRTNEGGRVTELCARPMLNLLYPELGGFIQPLAGEYGGFRSVLESVCYTCGYGVEVQTLTEIYEKFGLEAMAQTNLIEREHRHQQLHALSKMSFAIMQTILRKHLDAPDLSKKIMVANVQPMKQNGRCNGVVEYRKESNSYENTKNGSVKSLLNENKMIGFNAAYIAKPFTNVEVNEYILPNMKHVRELFKV